MHEFGIAQGIVKAVSAQADGLGDGERVMKVAVRVGALSGIDVEALRFSFNAITSDSEFADLELVVECQEHRRACETCSNEFEVDVQAFDSACPSCGNPRTSFVTGDELEIAYLEVDDG